VLDVGAGAGRYTFAVAPLVQHVTAVEPSAGMRAALHEEAARRGVTNVSVVPAIWQEADVEPHDLAFVANVLYFVADIVPFIEKLDRSATRACYIVHRVEERAIVYSELLTDIVPGRPPEAGFLDLYNLLFAMGIRADVKLVRPPVSGRYANLDEAVDDARQSLGVAREDHGPDDRIRAYLTRTLVQGPEGLGFPHGPQMAVAWWDKES
jgi:SAM-dependent methyltransferase